MKKLKPIKWSPRKSPAAVLARIRPSRSRLEAVERTVRKILAEVSRFGDPAVVRYTEKFDKIKLRPAGFRVPPGRIKAAYDQVDSAAIEHLRFAAGRIREFHERQKGQGWRYEQHGITLGQVLRPLDLVGLYVPGGLAAYPSSVLMNAIPAKVAGVPRVLICSPTPRGEISPAVLVAADIAGVDEFYTIGGAQAVGAMAYGTQTIPRVDKIVGPGNAFVAAAKRLVYGDVAIDMIAGPSEILIIADDSADPLFIASDLISQAEHDEHAVSILVTPSGNLIRRVLTMLPTQIAQQPRRKVIQESLGHHGTVIQVRDLEQAVEVANLIAPEHLELAVERPEALLPSVRHAGAVFLGHFTTESLGDYVAGPNHVLPTGGTARFSSPLSVDDFVKKTSLIGFTREGLKQVRDSAIAIGKLEGLYAHARAVEVRLP